MAVTLTLGSVVFSEFEIPESINFGGEQMLVVKKLPGGNRVIDAMGPDDDDIHWSGRFRGPSGEERALLLDHMRRQGNKVLLSWGPHRYQVVIKEFKPDYRNAYEIPYSIACTVALDEVQALASLAIGFAEAMVGDLLKATGLGNQIGSAAINTALTGVGTALSNYQAGVPSTTNLLTAATAPVEGTLLNGLMISIGGAQAATDAATTSVGAAINTTGSIAGVSAGGSPAAMAGALAAQAGAFGQLDLLNQLSSTLGRMSTNTSNAGS